MKYLLSVEQIRDLEYKIRCFERCNEEGGLNQEEMDELDKLNWTLSMHERVANLVVRGFKVIEGGKAA